MSDPLRSAASTITTPRADAADEAIAPREVPPVRRHAGRELADEGAARRNRLRQLSVLGRIDHVDAAPQHGDGPAPAPERAPVRGRVHAPGEAADHVESLPGQALPEIEANLQSVRRGKARPDDGDGVRAGSGNATRPQDRRRIRNRLEAMGVVRAAAKHDADALRAGLLQRRYRSAAQVRRLRPRVWNLQQGQHRVEVDERPRIGTGDVGGLRVGRRRPPDRLAVGALGPEQGQGDQVNLSGHGDAPVRGACQRLAPCLGGGYSGRSPACS